MLTCSKQPRSLDAQISKVISGIPRVLNNQDDMIGGTDWDENITSKSGKSSIDFHGHLFTQEGLVQAPARSKLCKSNDARHPNPRKSWSLLSRYISNFLSRCEPLLRQMTKADAKFEWITNQEWAFLDLKAAITSVPVLIPYCPEHNTLVICDGSPTGLGGGLLQCTQCGYQPVHYVSCTLMDMESRYSQIEREALAAECVMARLQMYLLGAPRFQLENRPQAPTATFQQAKCQITTTHQETGHENAEPWLWNDTHSRKNQHDQLHVQTPTTRNWEQPSGEACKSSDWDRPCSGYGQNKARNSKGPRTPVTDWRHSNCKVEQRQPRPQTILQSQGRPVCSWWCDPKA